jgi:hypothetical protein
VICAVGDPSFKRGARLAWRSTRLFSPSQRWFMSMLLYGALNGASFHLPFLLSKAHGKSLAECLVTFGRNGRS